MAGCFQANDVKPSWWYFLTVDENLVSWKEIPVELPEQLKANRERLGLSQEDVAHAIFVSRQTMSSWERGKTYPDVQSLLLLSKLFGVSIDELVKGDVVSMKETISKDAARMERLSWASMLLLIIGSVSMIVFVSALDSRMILPRVSDGVLAGFTSFFIFAVLAMICAVHIEKIKAAHNLVSYREISAFMDGEEVSADKSALGRKHPCSTMRSSLYVVPVSVLSSGSCSRLS